MPVDRMNGSASHNRMVARSSIDDPEAEIRSDRTTVELTIIIVSFWCRNHLRNCLTSLELDGVTSYAKVVVLDNHSGDGTGAMVTTEFPWVEFRQTGANLGFARANNLALAELSTEFCLLLNPDTVVARLALQRSIEELRAHEDVGALGCKLVKADGSFDHACKRSFPNLLDSILYFTHLDRLGFRLGRRRSYVVHELGKNDAGEVDAINGAFMLVRSAAIADVGLLDERFWMYGEDLDWCFRFWERGWKVYYWPGAEVVHIKGGSEIGARSWKSNRGFHEAMWLFYEKHYGQDHSRVSNAAVRLGIYVKLAVSGARIAAKKRRRISSARPSR